jgi:AraC-like DNA-binding protein
MKKSVSRYIRERRLSLAASFLNMNFKIRDVASMVGINDPAQFSRLFKEFYGISPKKYQMIHSPSGMNNGSDWPDSITSR